MLLSGVNSSTVRSTFSPFVLPRASQCTLSPRSASLVSSTFLTQVSKKSPNCATNRLLCLSRKPDQNPSKNPNSTPKPKPIRKTRHLPKDPKKEVQNSKIPFSIPKKPRRGRRGEAAEVEDFVRGSLERTLESIGKQNPEILKNVERVIKEKAEGNLSSEKNGSWDESDSDEDDTIDSPDEEEMVIDEEHHDWPLDADVGWGIRASEYFDKHSIKNVVGEDGFEIDWVGEIDRGLVKEINCLEWESFAFHPSPLVVLVFERYARASENWKVLKELEKAAEVYWKAKDRLPPRTVKVDINIERDLAYALKVKECPQILFLRGNTLLYREKDFRSADELVQMIAHFYYNAKKPSCINDAFIRSPY